MGVKFTANLCLSLSHLREHKFKYSFTKALQLNKDTLSNLIQKHPMSKMASHTVLLNGPLQNIHLSKFQSINKVIIRRAVTGTKESSGTPGVEADGWHRILASNNFGASSSDLRRHLQMSKNCELILLKPIQ